MRLFVLDCGNMVFPYNALEAGSKDDTPTSFPVEVYLIEHDEGYILFDAGCDPEGMSGSWPEEYRKLPITFDKGGSLPQRLETLGVRPDDIKYVVASHLHFDHAGCLHLFRKARIFVNKEELESTLHAYENKLDMNAHLASDVKNWIKADIKWEKLSSDISSLELAEGVDILNFGPGHSWGMLGLMVRLPRSGNQLLVSDAIYTNINRGLPERLPVLLCDKEGYRRTARFIESYAANNNAAVIYGHDAGQFKALIKKTQGCME